MTATDRQPSMTSTQAMHIAFVDPFASTKLMATSLKAAGIRTTVIYTVDKLQNSYIALQPELFDHAFFLNNPEDITAIIASLAKLGVNRVYYGSEISVHIADQIANALCPDFANSMESSAARSDKYEMQEAVRRAGIHCVKQMDVTFELTAEQENELINWDYPIVIKPVNNASSLGVERCESFDEIKSYLENQTTSNQFGHAIERFVIQECLIGNEYFVDTFSIQGEHFVSGVQRSGRKLYRNKPISVYSEIISSDTPDAIASIEYVKQVLTAVGLNNGLGHTEIMFTEKGPCLIEVNPRMAGAYGYNNRVFQVCGVPAHLDQMIAHCTNTAIPTPNQTRYGRKICMQNYQDRVISDLNIPLLSTLPSFVEATMLKKPGSFLSYPQSLADIVAFAILAHPDKQQVLDDHQQILEWEEKLELF